MLRFNAPGAVIGAALTAQLGRSTIGTAKNHGPLLRRRGLVAWQRHEARARGFVFVEGIRGSIKARIEQGRWLVLCESCPGAEAADPGEPVFYCLSCGNIDNGNHVMAVEFPAERADIETILLKRPKIENRNWHTGETLADLRGENIAHAVGV